jgi:NADPH:quinone reductase-like Zn-dependent oxidoreductase
LRAFALDSFGEPGSMRELPTPGPVDGQVLVRVCAAGVNPFDAYVAGGYAKDVLEHRFPLVPGHDAAGVVEAVGDGVEQPAVGDEVFGAVGKPYLGEGTYAEMATMSAATLWPKTVRYWQMTPAGGTLRPAGEVDDARWVPFGEARAALTYARDRGILDRFHPPG